MKKIRINWNSERLLGFSAIGISFITLIIFIYQTNIMRMIQSMKRIITA